MKKAQLIVAIVGWFFTVSGPYSSEYPDVMLNQSVEGFKSAAMCKIARDEIIELFKLMGVKDTKISSCQEAKKA